MRLVAIEPRPAEPSDLAAITATITDAFHDDPVWGWAFPDPEERPAQYEVWWRFWIEGALPHGWVWTADESAATSVWLPPGAPEIAPEDEPRLGPLLTELLDARGEVLLAAHDRYERLGFRACGHFTLPDHGPTVTTMWRDPR